MSLSVKVPHKPNRITHNVILSAIYISYMMIACIALLLFMACYYQHRLQADPLTPYCSLLLKILSKGYLMSYNSQNFYLIQYSSHLLMLP